MVLELKENMGYDLHCCTAERARHSSLLFRRSIVAQIRVLPSVWKNPHRLEGDGYKPSAFSRVTFGSAVAPSPRAMRKTPDVAD